MRDDGRDLKSRPTTNSSEASSTGTSHFCSLPFKLDRVQLYSGIVTLPLLIIFQA
jgi:hypothetical protein